MPPYFAHLASHPRVIVLRVSNSIMMEEVDWGGWVDLELVVNPANPPASNKLELAETFGSDFTTI